MNNMFNKFIDKITSARFILTIVLSAVYAYLAIQGKLTTEFNATYMMIVVFYFSKERVSPSNKDDTHTL